MEDHYFYNIIKDWGVYAIFVLCMIEGDITLLISGVMAHSRFFGDYSFGKVFFFGMAGGVAGDSFGYWLGRFFANKIEQFKFYQKSQPRIERLVDKFGGLAIVVSKYIYGVRVAICISSGVGKMPFSRFLLSDLLSCSIWALLLAGVGYFFSGLVTSIIGDFQRIGIALLVIVAVGILAFYLVEKLWLSKKVETIEPETIHMLEEKIHDIGDRLHIPHKHEEKLAVGIKSRGENGENGDSIKKNAEKDLHEDSKI
jgi:membrane protein DedA with SNARE-associated domain